MVQNFNVAIAGFFLIILSASAQSNLAEFEAASVKPTPATMSNVRGGPGTADPGLFECTACSVGYLLKLAFRAQSYQLVLPEWAGSTMFDVSAKVPASATKDQFAQMIQSLLIQRFQLRTHRDSKEMAVFDLLVAHGGPKLTPARPTADAPTQERVDKDGYPNLPPGCRGCMLVIAGKGRFHSAATTMADFAEMLSLRLNKYVFDKTALTGEYDIDVLFEPGDLALPLADAVPAQLGLKLDPHRAPIGIVVVDNLAKVPSEN